MRYLPQPRLLLPSNQLLILPGLREFASTFSSELVIPVIFLPRRFLPRLLRALDIIPCSWLRSSSRLNESSKRCQIEDYARGMACDSTPCSRANHSAKGCSLAHPRSTTPPPPRKSRISSHAAPQTPCFPPVSRQFHHRDCQHGRNGWHAQILRIPPTHQPAQRPSPTPSHPLARVQPRNSCTPSGIGD